MTFISAAVADSLF